MRSRYLLLSAIFCLTSPCSAEDSPWEFTGAAGLSFADGNSDSLAYSLQFLGSYIRDGEELYLGADYFYSEDNGVRSTDSLKIHGQYNHSLTGRFYVGGYGGYFRDDAADIGYRIDPSLLLGYKVIARDGLKLAFEAGPGYTWVERNGTESDFATLRFAEKFEWRFNPTTRFWQSVSITPEVGDFGKYLLDFEAGIETRITPSWSLRTFVRHRIDSDPSPGKGRSDTALILGLAYELGGLPEPEESGGRRSLIPGEDGGGDDSKGWVSAAALGFSLNKGNSDSSGLNLAWNTAYRSAEREFFFDLAQALREDNGATSEDRTSSRVQYNRFLDKRRYVGATVGFLRDGQADINYRITPGILVGYALIKNGTTVLSFEAGPAYTFESGGGVDETYASLIAAERFSHKFNDRLTLVQSFEVTSELADFGNHSFLASLGLDTKISDRLIWKTAATYTYESRPSANRVHHDTALTSAIALRF